jgi:hypothetical protein
MPQRIEQTDDLVNHLTGEVMGIGDAMKAINQRVDGQLTELMAANYISAVMTAFLARWEGEIVPEWNAILGRLEETAMGTNKAVACQAANQTLNVGMPV